MSTPPRLSLTRRIAAAPARVFAAWIRPETMMRWWGPAGAETFIAEIDPRVGGRFRTVMRTADGQEHEVSGTYLEIVADMRLVFTWAWRSTPDRESLVTVEVMPAGNGTLLTLTHERFYDQAARDGHKGGWSEALVRLGIALTGDPEGGHHGS